MRCTYNGALQEASQRKTRTSTTRIKLHWQQWIPRKRGRIPMVEASQQRRTIIRIRSATTVIIRGISRTRAGRSTLRRSQSFQRIAKASKQAGSSVATAVIDDSKGEIILAATSHGEQYVYLDHEVISDDEESILEVFTGWMHNVNITNAHQYVPVIDDAKFLEGIKLLEELKERKIQQRDHWQWHWTCKQNIYSQKRWWWQIPARCRQSGRLWQSHATPNHGNPGGQGHVDCGHRSHKSHLI